MAKGKRDKPKQGDWAEEPVANQDVGDFDMVNDVIYSYMY